jgi:crossover junction endodeoxyribonuclease RuvC
MTRPIRILGIDPGLRRTGWGMVEIAGNRLGFLGCGSVTTRDEDRSRRGSSPSMTA